jgi:hypothetical protein
MQNRERQLIQDLFDRLRGAENQRRDPEVERLIADELRRAPHAPYAMAQTIIAQNQALEEAAARIQQLEGGRNYGRDDDEDEYEAPRRGAMGAPGLGRRGSVPSFGGAAQGGGFLASAGQVAMGVAGGMLMAEAAKSLLGSGSEAQAATAASGAADNSLAQDAGLNDVGSNEASGSEGGGGLFGWLFGGGNDNGSDGGGDRGHDTADAGFDDGGGWDSE